MNLATPLLTVLLLARPGDDKTSVAEFTKKCALKKSPLRVSHPRRGVSSWGEKSLKIHGVINCTVTLLSNGL